MDISPRRVKLSERDKKVYTYINERGYVSPIEIKIEFDFSEIQYRTTIEKLHLCSLVCKLMKGLVVSLEWAHKHEEKAARVERITGMVIH